MKAILFSAAALLALSACSVREARIAVPSEVVAASDRLDLRGMGGGASGTFRLADGRGVFDRSSERLGLFDPLLVRRSGGGSFTLGASSLGPELSGRCRYVQKDVNVGALSITPQRLAYRCEFGRDGRRIAADLLLEDPAPFFGTVHGRSERIGTLRLDGRELGIRSLHRDAQGGLPAPTPLGYAFEADGRQVGAIDLNGLAKTLYLPRDPALREAVLAASLALSVLWDPADVQEDS